MDTVSGKLVFPHLNASVAIRMATSNGCRELYCTSAFGVPGKDNKGFDPEGAEYLRGANNVFVPTGRKISAEKLAMAFGKGNDHGVMD